MIAVDPEVRRRFPTLRLAVVEVRGVKVVKGRDEGLEALIEEAVGEVKAKYDITGLKDLPLFRLYRDFFWRLGIDPTKDRPSAEALIRRVLRGKPFPAVNNLVDAYNVASMRSAIPLAAFDMDAISWPLVLRFSRPGEIFLGIGMSKPVELTGKEIVISDREGPIAIYPHRDSDRTKITLSTVRALIVACGAPGVQPSKLKEAASLAAEYITRFCGGTAGEIQVI